jgi:hypothetical protein
MAMFPECLPVLPSYNARPKRAQRGTLKLPRFGGVFDGFVDYGSVVATSIIASYAIGER